MIGYRIKEERLKYKYSRETFAELIDITPQHLFNVESGRRRLSYEKLAKVCEVLNVTADYLSLIHIYTKDYKKLIQGSTDKALPRFYLNLAIIGQGALADVVLHSDLPPSGNRIAYSPLVIPWR